MDGMQLKDYLPSGSSSLSSISTLFHSLASGTPRRARFFLLPNTFSGSCLGPNTSASTSAQDTVMRVSPLIFLGASFTNKRGFSADSIVSCDVSGQKSLPSSKAMKAPVIRRSTLPGAWLGLLCRHRSEQYFAAVDAAFAVCDFRVPLNEDSKYLISAGTFLILIQRKYLAEHNERQCRY